MIIHNLRELFYNRNPGDARVKVGSERKVASRRRGPSFGVAEIGYFSRAFCPRGLSKLGPSIRRITPKKLLGGTRAKRQSSSGVRELCWRSDAQMLSQIAHRSLVFLGKSFRPWAPKTVPKTVPILPDFETVPKPSRVQASSVVRLQVAKLLEGTRAKRALRAKLLGGTLASRYYA